jgi:hypothetical protein
LHKGCLTRRCSGGREALFIWFFVRPFAAPLNAGVRHRRASSFRCSDAAARRCCPLLAASCRAPMHRVRFVTIVKGAAVRRGGVLKDLMSNKPLQRSADRSWLMTSLCRPRPLNGGVRPPRTSSFECTDAAALASPSSHRSPLPRSRATCTIHQA